MVAFFCEARNIGSFKALFCLHFMYRLAITEECRLTCKLEMERALVAEWGTGLALGAIAGDAPADVVPGLKQLLPSKQKEAGPAAIRACTVFAILLCYSRLGGRIMANLGALGRAHGVHVRILQYI